MKAQAAFEQNMLYAPPKKTKNKQTNKNNCDCDIFQMLAVVYADKCKSQNMFFAAGEKKIKKSSHIILIILLAKNSNTARVGKVTARLSSVPISLRDERVRFNSSYYHWWRGISF